MLHYNTFYIPEDCIVCSNPLVRESALNCGTCGATAWYCDTPCLMKTHTALPLHMIYGMDPNTGRKFFCNVAEDIGGNHCKTCDRAASFSPVCLISKAATIYKNVTFCTSCSSIGDALQKLKYYPARYGAVRYRYAFSVELLDLYRTICFYSGMSMYKFIKCVLRFQSNHHPTFTERMLYRAFAQVFPEYRRACTSIERLDDLGLEDLFTRCRCCPRPGEEGRLHLAADGNFSAFRHNRKNQNVDMDDMENHFFISESVADTYAANEPKRTKVSDDKECSDFNALSNPNKRRFGEMDETGMFAIWDGRHETPLKILDMKKGEGFSLLDLLLIEYLDGNVAEVTMYYDVACRYKRHVEVVLID